MQEKSICLRVIPLLLLGLPCVSLQAECVSPPLEGVEAAPHALVSGKTSVVGSQCGGVRVVGSDQPK